MEIRRSLQQRFVETPAAKETVLYANTATFLFDRLRKDTSASYVAKELSAGDIVALIREKAANPRNPVELLWTYVLLAALSLKSFEQIRAIRADFEEVDLSRVQWGNQLRTAVLNRGPGTNVVRTTYTESRSDRSSPAANVTTNVIKLGQQR